MGIGLGKLAPIDVAIIAVYLVGITILGSWIGRFIKNDEDFFLGGRNLPWWAIGMSMVATDIGALELVGIAGLGYTYGIGVANFDWIGCVPAMVVAAFVFIPYYWRAKVFTIPEFLGRRYNQYVRSIVAVLWGTFFLFMLGLFFYTAALTMEILCGWDLWFSVLLIAGVVGIYTFFGGLSAVVFLDSIQCVILFIGSGLIMAIAMFKAGGWTNLMDSVHAMGPEYANHFKLIAPPDSTTPFAWSSVLFGLALVLSPAYWLGNQAIVQRNLAAKSEYEAKKSVLWGGFLKLFIPIVLVGPGIAGVVLHPGLEKGDMIFPTLIHQLLPPGLVGVVFAAFLAALISTVDSYLTSAATLWTKDIYGRFIVKNASPRHYMKVGKTMIIVFVIVGVSLARLAEYFESVFGYMQTMLSIFQGPLLSIILLGLLWRGATSKGAIAGLVLGVLTSSTLFWLKDGLFTAPEPFLYIAWWAFLVSFIITVVVSLFTEKKTDAELEGLIYARVLRSSAAKEGGAA